MENATNPLLDSFARVLRQRRLAAGLSQEELAHRAGLSMRYVSLLESRKHMPSLDTMQGLARGLGMSLTDLVSEAEAGLRDGPET
ncbi:helix-turn-helix domain-containing protein [Paenirhodobacter enshiensis]|uniref:DNA-binding protein n=1 Tax=Paenirhodobacter enshiensis TaxID=1105367 RepID=A0A086Y3N1_9RHOB|nr:helix-turn-helix transcriptional regulator [Paenirhodobacter enshiensis]KFI28881.1 DNA-binding protein [Paenirhodobacter enshiensis]